MKRLQLTAVALVCIWITFVVLQYLLSLTTLWHIVIAVLVLLVCVYGTYKAIKAAYDEWSGRTS